MGTPYEWISALVSGAIFCTLLAVFGWSSNGRWRNYRWSIVARIGVLFFGSLGLGLFSSFGERAFHGGLLWIFVANILGTTVSGIALHRLRTPEGT